LNPSNWHTELATGYWQLETGNWKLETGDYRLGNNFFGNFATTV
jgi:hypothetical protein